MARVHNLVAHPHKTLFISSIAPTARARRVHTRTAANDFGCFLAKVLPGHLFLALRTFPFVFFLFRALLAVPDVHCISLPRGLYFLFQAHSTFARCSQPFVCVSNSFFASVKLFFQSIQVEVLESPVVLDGIRHRHTHVLLAVGSSQPYVRWT
jgi:hypothetical protein